MRDEDAIRLRHMLDAATQALSFAGDRRREDLDQDRQLVWALIKAVEIIGEAAAQVSEEARSEAPNLPWRNIIGMRNRLVHAYYDINLDILWKTIIEGLPPLVTELKRYVPEEN